MGKAINIAGGTLTAKDHAVINNCLKDGSTGIAAGFGNEMAHRLDSVNELAVLDGFAMVQGRCYVIYAGDEEKLVIRSGSQGMKRHDLVVLEFDNALEKLELKVLEGVESSDPTDPEIIQDNTLGGGNLYQMPLYRVLVDGLNVTIEDLREYMGSGGGNRLFDTIYPIGSVYLSASNINPSTFFSGTTWQLIGTKLAVSENVVGNGVSLGLTDGSRLGGLIGETSGDKTAGVENFNKPVGTTRGSNYLASNNLGVPTKAQLGNNLAGSGLIVVTEEIYSWKRTA